MEAKSSESTKPPERKSLLTVSTLAPERPVATVDDVAHEFRLMQDFGSVEHAEFQRDIRRYDQLWSAEKRTRAENREMVAVEDHLLDRVLVDPKALRDQFDAARNKHREAGGDEQHAPALSGAIKREFILTFTNAPQLMTLLALQETAEKARDESSTTES